jgi:hypothetical protein
VVPAKAGGGCFGIRRSPPGPVFTQYREGVTSMKRALMFLLLAPASVVTAWLIYDCAHHATGPFVGLVATILFLFTLFVASIAGLVDGLLARGLPAILRAFLTAVVGAVIPASVILAISGCVVPQSISLPFALGGALCMGTCSLLSNDFGQRQRRALPAGA